MSTIYQKILFFLICIICAVQLNGQEIIFSDNFDSGAKPGWTTGATGINGGTNNRCSWQCGSPSGGYGFRFINGTYSIIGNPDPVTDHSDGSGNGVYGQGLGATQYIEGVSSHYSNSNEYLVSPKINCRMFISVTLSFWRWANFQRNIDKTYLEISNDKVTWKPLSHPTTVQDMGWTYYSINISSYANRKSAVYIRWRSTSDSAQHYSGWNIDDVTITGINISSLEWTGAYSNEWGNGANWNYPAIPDTSTNVIIHASAFNPVITSARKCKNITINPGAGLLIESGGSLTVNRDMHLVNNSSGKSSLINNGILNILGNTVIDAPFSANTWTFYSCPVSNTPVSYFNAGRNLYYHEPYGANNWTMAWSRAVNTFVNAKGYDMRYGSDTLVSLITKNELNKGPINIKLYYTDGAETDDHEGWNLVGNPYASYLDWDAFSLPSSVNNATYVYDGSTKMYLTYSNGIGINGGSRFIEPSTAFFVKMNTPGTATLHFSDTARTLSAETGQGLKSTGSQEKVLALKISGTGYADETALRFNDAASSSFDNHFDALKMFITDVPQIYTRDIQNNNYAINSLPDIQGYLDVPLSVKTTASSSYTIDVTRFEFNPCETVILEDTKTSIMTNLASVGSYSFTAGPTDNPDRFILHFGLNLVTSNGAVINNNALLPLIYNHNQTLNINLADESQADITVYDMSGRIMRLFNASNSYSSQVLGLPAGCYLVRVTTGTKSVSRRIIVE